jgi:lysophospholipase L1-like esterase
MKKLLALLILLTSFLLANAQEAPFLKDIQNFKQKDSIQFPPKNAVLFVGSSTFTNWKDVQQYFPKHVIINRGFGGSSLPHLMMYAKDIIFPYKAKQIVIYCGENDFTGNASVADVVQRAKKLFESIRGNDPKVAIVYVSIKPSPSREQYLPQMKEANKQIAVILKNMKNTAFINTFDAMFNADGTIRKDIFNADMLHMNAKGYAIWQKIMEPYLK